jgi:tight adherence protein B
MTADGAAAAAGVLVALAVGALPPRGGRSRDRALRLRPGPGRPGGAGPVPDAADLAEHLAAAFRAGLPPSRTWALLAARPGPFAGLAAAVALRLELGLPSGRSLLPSAGRRGAVLMPVAAALDLCERSGAPTADVLERLAAGLRAEAAAATDARIALAAPRATAGVLSLLPIAGLGLGVLLGVDTVHVLVSTPAGHACLLLGVAAWAAGRWWIHRLVASARSAGDDDP